MLSYHVSKKTPYFKSVWNRSLSLALQVSYFLSVQPFFVEHLNKLIYPEMVILIESREKVTVACHYQISKLFHHALAFIMYLLKPENIFYEKNVNSRNYQNIGSRNYNIEYMNGDVVFYEKPGIGEHFKHAQDGKGVKWIGCEYCNNVGFNLESDVAKYIYANKEQFNHEIIANNATPGMDIQNMYAQLSKIAGSTMVSLLKKMNNQV